MSARQFDPEAAKDIDETNWPGVTLLKVQMNTDLLTDDLKKKRSSNESYWLIGQPDVELRSSRLAPRAVAGKEEQATNNLYEVEVRGFDYYNPRTGQIESGDTARIAMWLLDTDYDGQCTRSSRLSYGGMDWQRNDYLGWKLEYRSGSKHRRHILRAIRSDFHTYGNGNGYTELNIYLNSHCDSERYANSCGKSHPHGNSRGSRNQSLNTIVRWHGQ